MIKKICGNYQNISRQQMEDNLFPEKIKINNNKTIFMPEKRKDKE
jgi:hypothetical protein